MRQYEDFMRHVFEHGVVKADRTGTGTRSWFGYQMRFDLGEGFPLITTKKLHLRSIIHELLWFLQGSSNVKYQYYLDTRRRVEGFDQSLAAGLSAPRPSNLFETMVTLYNQVHQGYTEELKKLYQLDARRQLTEVDISTLINFNREFFACYKAMVWAVKDYLLEKEQASYFAELPGFIR